MYQLLFSLLIKFCFITLWITLLWELSTPVEAKLSIVKVVSLSVLVAYQKERKKTSKRIHNFVILSKDIHTKIATMHEMKL